MSAAPQVSPLIQPIETSLPGRQEVAEKKKRKKPQTEAQRLGLLKARATRERNKKRKLDEAKARASVGVAISGDLPSSRSEIVDELKQAMNSREVNVARSVLDDRMIVDTDKLRSESEVNAAGVETVRRGGGGLRGEESVLGNLDDGDAPGVTSRFSSDVLGIVQPLFQSMFDGFKETQGEFLKTIQASMERAPRELMTAAIDAPGVPVVSKERSIVTTTNLPDAVPRETGIGPATPSRLSVPEGLGATTTPIVSRRQQRQLMRQIDGFDRVIFKK